MAINTMVLISSLDLEKCISLSFMLKKKATIWADQFCVTRFIFKSCLCESLFSLNGYTSLQIPSLCYFVDVSGLPIHPVLNSVPYLHIQNRATDQSWLLPSPAARMWHQNDDGTPKLLEGALLPSHFDLFGRMLLLIIRRRIKRRS